MLGREPVVDGDHHAAVLDRPAHVDQLEGLGVGEAEGTPVDAEDRGQGPHLVFRAVHEHAHVGCAVGTRDEPLLDADLGFEFGRSEQGQEAVLRVDVVAATRRYGQQIVGSGHSDSSGQHLRSGFAGSYVTYLDRFANIGCVPLERGVRFAHAPPRRCRDR